MTKPKPCEVQDHFLLLFMERKQVKLIHRMTSKPKPDQREGEERLRCEAEIFISQKPSLPCPWAVQYFKVAGKYSHLHSHHCAQADKNFKEANSSFIYQI